jgi:hypothetical protein
LTALAARDRARRAGPAHGACGALGRLVPAHAQGRRTFREGAALSGRVGRGAADGGGQGVAEDEEVTVESHDFARCASFVDVVLAATGARHSDRCTLDATEFYPPQSVAHFTSNGPSLLRSPSSPATTTRWRRSPRQAGRADLSHRFRGAAGLLTPRA